MKVMWDVFIKNKEGFVVTMFNLYLTYYLNFFMKINTHPVAKLVIIIMQLYLLFIHLIIQTQNPEEIHFN